MQDDRVIEALKKVIEASGIVSISSIAISRRQATRLIRQQFNIGCASFNKIGGIHE